MDEPPPRQDGEQQGGPGDEELHLHEMGQRRVGRGQGKSQNELAPVGEQRDPKPVGRPVGLAEPSSGRPPARLRRRPAAAGGGAPAAT